MKLLLFSIFLYFQSTQFGTAQHPLDPLSSPEISATVSIIKSQFKPSPPVVWLFIWITLKEPEKAILYPYFATNTQPPKHSVSRLSFTILINPSNGDVYEVVTDLRKKSVLRWNSVDKNYQPMFAFDELDAVGKMLLEDPTVQKRLFKYQCTNLSLIVPDVWKYGYDGDKPEYKGKRMAQSYFYVRQFDNDNFYAHPLGFLAVIDTLSKKVTELQELPISSDFTAYNRFGDTIPKPGHSNFDPVLLPEASYAPKLNLINIQQPLGPSFTLSGNQLKWNHFGMRIGFNGREGVILHQISYNDHGHNRPLIYRASLSEVFVPYGDPRPPYHRKMPYDSGEYGVGFGANEIDPASETCKGSVVYLNFNVNILSGAPKELKNSVCIYEEDAGIAWRKKDPETERIVTLRGQRLVISFISTLSNYDYQFKWMFYQDGSIRFESLLTGSVDLNLVADGSTPAGHGSIIGKNLNGQFHQHFFIVRIDTDFDGMNNSVSIVDVKPDTDQNLNPYGNGFHAEETLLRTAIQGRTMSSPSTSRSWKISTNQKNPISGNFMGWKLIPENGPGPQVNRRSVMYPKSEFADYPVWITPYQEDQLYAGGFYLNNSGLPDWVGSNPSASIENKDIVLWHVVGLTHLPRCEDFPVMPSETVGFWLKPANFFTLNPSLDMKPF